MKKFVLFALVLSVSIIMTPAPSLAADHRVAGLEQQQPPPLSPEAAAAYAEYYNEKVEDARYQKAKAFLEKYADADPYWKRGPQTFVTNYELKKVYGKCQEADKTFFGSPNEANLNNFIGSCDAWISKAPTPDVYYTTRISLGTGYGVLAGFYKNTDRGMQYTEKALKLLSAEAAPEGWKPADWNNFRNENSGRLTQYQGLYKLRQTTPDNEAAIKYLSEAAAIKEGPAVKDPNTYLLRAEATTGVYTKLNNQYNTLTDDEKIGEPGKALLNQIYPVVEKMANDYARVVALTEGKAPFKAIYDDAKTQCEQFVAFLNKEGKPDELYALFKGDVSAPDAKIKTDDSVTTAPPVAPTNPAAGGKKLMAPTAVAGAAGPSGNGGASTEKATPAKSTKPAPKKRKR